MSAKVRLCERCRRRLRKHHLTADCAWNGEFERGVLVSVICPDCQTDAENAEAVIRESTTDYGLDVFGRVVGFSKRVAE